MNKLIKIQLYTVVGTASLLIIKFIAYFITDSNVILSDALESIINLLAGAFALYSLILAAKPKDLDHPYGHGKIEFISASVEGALIITAGIIIIGKSIYNFFIPYEINHLDIGIALTLFAGLVNFLMGRILIVQGKKNNSMTMDADGKHLLTDSYSTLGMLLGLGVVYFTDITIIDNIMAGCFGVFIAYTGINILKKSMPAIMDEADMDLLKEMIVVLQRERNTNWIDLHNLRVIKYGSSLHIDCHMTLPYYYELVKAHEEIENLENLVQKHFGEKVELFTHMDPCIESQCKLCELKECEKRKHAFESSVDWTLENTLKNQQHQSTI